MAEPADRVQLMKQESSALGGDDADTVEWGSTPIEPEEDAIEAAGYYGQEPGERDETVLIWREGNKWRAKDQTYGPLDLLAGGSGGISESEHDDYNKFLHNLDESHEIVPTLNSDGVLTGVVSRQPSAGNTIRQRNTLSVDGDGLITGFVATQHDEAGATAETMTAVVTISGGVPTVATLTRST